MSRALTYPKPSAVLELLKPITWFPPMWAFACGAIGAGARLEQDGWWIALVMFLAGPMVCATSQAINDWYDRHVDQINEPHRPIPSGRIPGNWGLRIACLWTLLSVLVSSYLGFVGMVAASLGLLLAWAYSAPPLRLKQNGWWGNLACGVCYEGVAWMTGVAVALQGAATTSNLSFSAGPLLHSPLLAQSLLLALAYSLSAHGIMTLNDFKSIKGDTQMGIRSLPVQYGPQRAGQLAAFTMIAPQIFVIVQLASWGKSGYAVIIAFLVLLQGLMLRRFLAQPVEKALWYSGLGVPVLVSGMMVAALAIRP